MNKELNLSRTESSFIIVILKKHSELMLEPCLRIAEQEKCSTLIIDDIKNKIHEIDHIIKHLNYNSNYFMSFGFDSKQKSLLKDSYHSAMERSNSKLSYLNKIAVQLDIENPQIDSDLPYKSLLESITEESWPEYSILL